MIDEVTGWGPFDTGPLSVWRLASFGAATPMGITLPDLPKLFDDEDTPPPLIERDGTAVTMHFHGIARFRIDFSDTSITAFDVVPDTLDEVIVHLLHDHVAPRLLAQLGTLVLHASIVQFDDRLALFLGETGAGKSTLATSLHQAGYPLLGDDAAIVTPGPRGFQAQAVYPSLRLFPETIAHLLGSETATSPMAHHSDKQNVHLPSIEQACADPLPVSAIFFLGGDCGAHAPAIAPFDRIRACIALIEQSFSLDPADAQCAARRLAVISRLVQAVPAYRLTYPHDFAQLAQVHRVIETIMSNHQPIADAANHRSYAP